LLIVIGTLVAAIVALKGGHFCGGIGIDSMDPFVPFLTLGGAMAPQGDNLGPQNCSNILSFH